jgi:hypothetical protein
VIQSFVRVQTRHDEAGVEQGYNTDARPLQFDENNSPQFTRSLQLGSVPRVVIDGVVYRVFLLDVNQKSSQAQLSLDELRLYVGNRPDLTGYDATTKQLAGLSPVYDLNADGPNWVKLNARLNSGSGSGDMTFLVPDSVFGGADLSSFIYLYSKFGVHAGANGGFEEWAAGPTSGATAGLSGFVYADTDSNGVFNPAGGEFGLSGVTVTLVDDQGHTLTAKTGPNGLYQFTGLGAGIYTLIEGDEPAALGFSHELANVGTVGGNPDGLPSIAQISQVQINAGDQGINYNFGEIVSNGGPS